MSNPAPQERDARLVLHRLVEPADGAIGALVAATDAVTVLDAIRSRQLVELAEAHEDPAERLTPRRSRGLRSRLVAYANKLPSIDPGADVRAARELGAVYVIPGDPGWPSQLDDLGERRPLGLWIRGAVELRPAAARSVAVVGSRDSTPYGNHVASDFGAELAAAGWLVVSGAAFGIDAAAHRGALAANGPTCAVLACGIDRCYPRAHEGLLAAIAASGVIVSELPLGIDPNRFRFIDRNRLIAALTRGTVVVEAALRSGSLATARAAERLGRGVLGVPGPVTSRTSSGVHHLVRDGGAVLATSAAEVIEQLGSLGDDLADEPRGEDRARDHLDPVAARVVEALPARGSSTLLAAAREAGLDPADVHGALGRLAAEGWVECGPDGWRLIRR